jgi:pyruvate dehydrogenase kinase 2/3/4
MVQFGEKPSTGTLFRASQFLSEELPIRLAHRVQELDDLPDGLNEMPSIQRVLDWYAQSFEVGVAMLHLKARRPLTHPQ